MNQSQAFDLDWIPRTAGVRNAHCGAIGWHVVRMPSSWGRRVLDELGKATGAVVEEQHTRRMYWLIPNDSAANWQLPLVHGIEILDDGHQVLIPGTLRETALWWLVPPRPHRLLTDPDALLAAILAALGPRVAAS
ncbi:hypothetical protein [Streptomyces sp. KR80]|uniref:hypothetical protein n=1 Tax=Streptomyces sp. KR80 TaxID=3457426 RepID=UPI003FD20591